jgi:hypothetical protein
VVLEPISLGGDRLLSFCLLVFLLPYVVAQLFDRGNHTLLLLLQGPELSPQAKGVWILSDDNLVMLNRAAEVAAELDANHESPVFDMLTIH